MRASRSASIKNLYMRMCIKCCVYAAISLPFTTALPFNRRSRFYFPRSRRRYFPVRARALTPGPDEKQKRRSVYIHIFLKRTCLDTYLAEISRLPRARARLIFHSYPFAFVFKREKHAALCVEERARALVTVPAHLRRRRKRIS